MIGFKSTYSALENKEHRDRLKKQVPANYHKEIDIIYEWVSNRTFSCAKHKEDWVYCKRSMSDAPLMYIDRCIASTDHGPYMEVNYPVSKVSVPECRICDSQLGENVSDKVKHVVISCPCGRMYCHKKCADDHLLKHPQCYVCKNYYIYDFKNSGLIATIANQI